MTYPPYRSQVLSNLRSYLEIPQYELEGDGYSTKIIVNSIARFRLRLKSSKHNLLEYFALSIFDPYGHKIVVQHRILASDLLELTYQPMSVGQHRLQVCFNQKFHREIVLDVIHDEINLLSKLKPFGPGLKRAIAGQPTEFYVDLNQTSEHNQIHFRFEASYQAEIDYEQQLATVKYTPMSEGYLPIEIIENERELASSPFLVYVENLANIKSKPNIRVIGLDKQLILHRKTEFQIFIDNPFDDQTHTLHVEIITEHEQLPPVSIQRHPSSTLYTCSFIPIHSGRHLISIDYAGIVPQSNPFICQAIQEKDILLTGPAIRNQCLTLNEPTYFAFLLQDFLNSTYSDKTTTYESGYSSNDDMSSSKSSSYNDIPMIQPDENKNYQVTITDGHGNIKPNVYVQELADKQNDNLIRVDFTPDEKILYINISCTW